MKAVMPASLNRVVLYLAGCWISVPEAVHTTLQVGVGCMGLVRKTSTIGILKVLCVSNIDDATIPVGSLQ